MAGESYEDKADILKPSSSTSSSSSSPPPSHPSPAESKPPPSLCLRPQEFPVSERPEAPVLAAGASGGGSVGGSSPPKPAVEPQAPETPVRFCNRCSSCRKRVGLAGFRCRCGELFCPLHRHSATHDCCFDYKAAGREQIAKDNPLVRAAKIIKI